MTEPIHLAVVGHTNAGKTSLLRSLTRHPGFGEVSDRPGTTRHVEAIDLKVNEESLVRFYDTPGLEDSAGLIDYMKAQQDYATPPERIRAFLDSPEAQQRFEQEAKVLRKMLDVDAAMYVIDTREPDLPKFRYEIEILTWCGKPIMPVLNFVRAPDSRKDKWRAILAAYNLHTYIEFDAVAPFVGSERRLFSDLTVLLRPHEATLQRVIRELDKQAQQRRKAACRSVAETLVSLAALRRSISKEELEQANRKDAFIGEFQHEVTQRVRRCIGDLLQIYGFREDESEADALPWLNGHWEDTLFDPELLQDAAKRLGSGAVVGMALGLAADIAFAGLSLGTGTALGATLGGLGNQNWRQLLRKAYARTQGNEEMVLQNEVLLLTAERLLYLITVLEQRGHAAQDKIALGAGTSRDLKGRYRTLLQSLQPARNEPDWENQNNPARTRIVENVATAAEKVLNG